MNSMVRLLLRRCGSTSVEAGEQSLISWVRQEGGRVGALHQQASQHGGWGLRTTEAVKAGETLIALPPHLSLSVQTSDPLLLALFDRIPGVVDSQAWTEVTGRANKVPDIALVALHSESSQNVSQCLFFSHQKKFKRFNTFPSHTRQEIEHFLVQFENDDTKHPFNSHLVLPHALAWSMAAVSSRAFHVHKEGGGSSLLPLVDMCNHSFAPTGRLVQHRSESQSLPVLEVVAERDLDKGENIVLNYGPLSNDILLLDYGFVMHNNPNDRVELRYDGQLLDTACLAGKVDSLSSFQHPAPWQQTVLALLKLHGPGSSQVVTLGGTELVEGRLLAEVRVMYAQDSHNLVDVDLKALQVWDRNPPLGVMNERKAIRTLIGLGILALASFPTVIQEDESDLVKGDISENHRIAVQFRMLKKHLLLDIIKRLKAKYPA